MTLMAPLIYFNYTTFMLGEVYNKSTRTNWKGGFLMATVSYNDFKDLRDDETVDIDPIRSKDIILE